MRLTIWTLLLSSLLLGVLGVEWVVVEDSDWEGCNTYHPFFDICGDYDDDDFTSSLLCCYCGGGDITTCPGTCYNLDYEAPSCPHTCTCTGGTAALASDGSCDVDGAEDCTACDGGYTLSDQRCNACADIMDEVDGVVDGSCTDCDGGDSADCAAATCDTDYHTFADGVGCSACADIMDGVDGVEDGSCTDCDGANPADCAAATCDTGYHTFVAGVGCSECTAVDNAQIGATYTCTTAGDSDVSRCADGFEEDETGVADICIEINECDEMTCGGAASTCIDGINHFSCNCGAGWSGGGVNQLCRDMDQCQAVVCGGTTSTCVDGDNQYRCTCGAGWSGGGVMMRCTADSCDASEAPLHGQVGTCGSDLTSGTSCQPDCDMYYIVSGDSSCKEGILNAATCEHICSCGSGGTATSGDACPGSEHCCMQPNGATASCTACRGEHFLNGGSCDAWAAACEPNQIMTQGPSHNQDRICQESCPDEQSPYMVKKNKSCKSWGNLVNRCNKSEHWRANRYCQQSCRALGLGYEDDNCPQMYTCSNSPSSHMVKKGRSCESWPHLRNMCNLNKRWRSRRFCQKACYDLGLGYNGDDC